MSYFDKFSVSVLTFSDRICNFRQTSFDWEMPVVYLSPFNFKVIMVDLEGRRQVMGAQWALEVTKGGVSPGAGMIGKFIDTCTIGKN